MKKTILAMAVPALLAAGAAQASITLYDEDGTSVQLSGAAEVQYRKSGAEDAFNPARVVGNEDSLTGASTDDGQLRVDDGDLALRITHTEGENYAFGAIELRIGEDKGIVGKGSGAGDVVNDGLYVGFGGTWGELSFGRQLAIIDDAGIGVDYELKDVAGVDFQDTDYDQLIKYRYSGEGYWFGASYNIPQDNSKNLSNDELFEFAFGVNIIDSLEVRSYYADIQNEQSDVNAQAWDIELAFNEGPFYAGILYGNLENKSNAGIVDSDTDTIEVAASYTFGKNKVGAGAAYNDGMGRSESTSYYINYGYNLLTNCRLYTEVGFEDVQGSDASGDWDGVGYVAGIEVKF